MEQTTGSPIAKLVLVKLADNANEDGVCWPSVRLMVQHTELGERTVRAQLKVLEEAGLIERQERITERGQVSNLYQLKIPSVWAHPPAAGTPSPGSRRTRSRPQQPQAPAAAAPPYKEPSIEPPLNRATLGEAPESALFTKLRSLFQPTIVDTWFAGATFREGPPLTLVLTKAFRCNWVRDHFGIELRRTFGDELVFDYAR